MDPSDPMCFAGFASNLREHGSFDRAADVMGAALAPFPDAMVVLTEGARLAAATNRPKDAFKLYEKAIALHGSHPEWVAGRDRARIADQDLAGSTSAVADLLRTDVR